GKDTTQWILLLSINPGGPNGGSATQYFVGHFDGQKFVNQNPDTTTIWLDGGRDNYAGVTWNNIPAMDGRRIFLGWMSNWLYGQQVPSASWRSAMTIPRQLTLHQEASGLRLHQSPVKEIQSIRSEEFSISNEVVTSELDLTNKLNFSPAQMEVSLEFSLDSNTTDFGISISNSLGEEYRIGYDAVTNQYYSDRTHSGKSTFSKDFSSTVVNTTRRATDQQFQWQVFFDVSSCEFFADNGEVVMTEIFFPNQDYDRIKFYTKGGSARIQNAEIYHIGSIFPVAQVITH
nr:GH32 C-terminal domain-containing protein [Bacteroidota bacterium]